MDAARRSHESSLTRDNVLSTTEVADLLGIPRSTETLSNCGDATVRKPDDACIPCEPDGAAVVGRAAGVVRYSGGTRPEHPPPRAAWTSARCALSIGQVGDRAFSDVSGMSRIAPGHRDTSPGGSCGSLGTGPAAKTAHKQAKCPQGVPATRRSRVENRRPAPLTR
jgi:hypothetical protein